MQYTRCESKPEIKLKPENCITNHRNALSTTVASERPSVNKETQGRFNEKERKNPISNNPPVLT